MIDTKNKLSHETAIQLVLRFNEEDLQEICTFVKACDFVMNSVDEVMCPTLLNAIQTRMISKAFEVSQFREITS